MHNAHHRRPEMPLLLTLPDALHVELLCYWLEFQDIVHLDSALCSDWFRPQFLDLLENKCLFPYIPFTIATKAKSAGWLAERGIKAKHLAFDYGMWHWDAQLNLLRNCSRTIEVLEVGYRGFNDESRSILFDVSEQCPFISELSVVGFKISEDLERVFEQCLHLRKLQLKNCRNLSENSIKAVCSSNMLLSLELDDSSFEAPIPQPTDVRSDTITELSVWKPNLTNKDLINLCAYFPKLMVLRIGPIHNTELCTIASRCPLIQDASVGLWNRLSDANAEFLCKQWPRVKLLQLCFPHAADCSEEAVIILLRGCSQLQKLSVCNLDYPNGKRKLYLSNSKSSSSSRSNAQLCKSSNCVTTGTSLLTDLFLESISEASLRVILTLCPQLNTLALRHAVPYFPVRDFTDASLCAAEYRLSLLNHPTCSVLKLHLHNMITLSMVDLLPLIRLEELQLSRIGAGIDNQALLRVLRNNPNLKSLSLYECDALDGQTLIPPVLKLCVNLHTLNYIEKNANHVFMVNSPNYLVVSVLEDVVRNCFPHIKTFNLIL